MPETVVEKQLSEIWRQQRIRPAGLATEGGKPVTIIYPGRTNDNRGGDYCDAVILVDGRKVTGDVELHVKSGDWTGHGHHHDARYNGVVLHVVWRSTGGPTVLENGTEVPVLELHERVAAEAPEITGAAGVLSGKRGRACLGAGVDGGERVVALLDELGDARFRANAETYGSQMAASEPGQVLFEGIMAALGYARNKAPFRELARRLPLRTLEAILSGMKGESESGCATRVRDVMLRVAGLVSREHGCAGPETTVAPACIVQPGGRGAASEHIRAMSANDWNLCRVRPNNSPAVRIGAASRLLSRYREMGVQTGLLDAVSEALGRPCGYLRKALLVAGVGQQRIDEIIANVLLPFAWAFGRACGERRLCRTAQALYREQRRLATNCLEKHMVGQLGLQHRQVNSARRQQGLIHIYKTRCSRGRCDGCPLAESEAGDDIDIESVGLAAQQTEVTAGGNHRRVVGTKGRRRYQHRQRRGFHDALTEPAIGGHAAS